ncbi:hypothetical protein [Streptosporangium sp. NPDC000396]|uniref:hypothetical protein n=1 Tax=Streptosporangium sp. NPDC000396 TaxID=3366185 RepID=UPI00368D9356
MKNLRRAFATLGAASVTLAAVLTATPADAASGGGCSSGTVRACISVNSSRYLVADGYLSSVPSGCAGVTVKLFTRSRKLLNSIDSGCWTGRTYSTSYFYSSDVGGFFTQVDVWNGNHNVITYAISPNQY